MEDEEAHASREEVVEESRERGEGGGEVVEGLLGDELEAMDFRGAGSNGVARVGKLDLSEMIDREISTKGSVRVHGSQKSTDREPHFWLLRN